MEVVDHWKPGRHVLFWARASIFAPIAIMVIGAVLIPVSPRITSGAVFVAVLASFFCLFRFWRELGHAEEIPVKARRQLRRNIPLSLGISPRQDLTTLRRSSTETTTTRSSIAVFSLATRLEPERKSTARQGSPPVLASPLRLGPTTGRSSA